MKTFEKIRRYAAALWPSGQIPNDAELEYFAGWCDAIGADPLVDDVYFLPYQNRDRAGGGYKTVFRPLVGINFMRKRAARTGEYLAGRPKYKVAGKEGWQDAFDPDKEKLQGVRWEVLKKGSPQWMARDVWACDMNGNFKYDKVYMLLKAAEVAALRAFFPEVGAVYLQEEISAFSSDDATEAKPGADNGDAAKTARDEAAQEYRRLFPDFDFHAPEWVDLKAYLEKNYRGPKKSAVLARVDALTSYQKWAALRYCEGGDAQFLKQAAEKLQKTFPGPGGASGIKPEEYEGVFANVKKRRAFDGSFDEFSTLPESQVWALASLLPFAEIPEEILYPEETITF
ncbi:MAG: recombinase RecT [Bacteroidia bacterium]|nr:recombinase RecT [Bacteroidia bacterium]